MGEFIRLENVVDRDRCGEAPGVHRGCRPRNRGSGLMSLSTTHTGIWRGTQGAKTTRRLSQKSKEPGIT